mgnify:CR=1 FL=1
MRRLVLTGCVLVGLALPAAAQGPACEDELRTVRILVEQVSQGRQRAEVTAAQTIGALLKRVEALEAEVKAAKTAPAPAKKD